MGLFNIKKEKWNSFDRLQLKRYLINTYKNPEELFDTIQDFFKETKKTKAMSENKRLIEEEFELFLI